MVVHDTLPVSLGLWKKMPKKAELQPCFGGPAYSSNAVVLNILWDGPLRESVPSPHHDANFPHKTNLEFSQSTSFLLKAVYYKV